MRGSRLEVAGLLLLVAYALVGALTLTSAHRWGDDWAQYVLHARNILAGTPYADTGYLFNPDAPYIGPPQYPPGLPLLLAPAIAALGVDLVALKLVCFMCFIAMLPVAYATLGRAFGRTAAFAAIVLFALHEQLWTLREDIGSEAPYMLFSMLALWQATRERADAPSGAITGLLVYASIACRSIGVAFVPALLLDAWARRRPVSWHAWFLVSLGAAMGIQALWVPPPTYSSELIVPGIALIAQNIREYWNIAVELVPMPVGFLSHAALAAVIALAGLGARHAFDRRAEQPPAVRSVVAGVPLPVWYTLAYLCALVLASIAPGARYLLPILPIVLALAAAGCAGLMKRSAQPQRLASAVALSLAIYYGYMHVTARVWRDDELATCDACRELYAFVRTRTPSDSVIAFAKPRALALLAQRRAWMWNRDYSPDVFRAKLHAARAAYLVTAAPGTYLQRLYPPYIDGAFETQLGATVFRNAMFSVIELRR